MKPKIPQGRDECSMEQLIEIQRIIGEKSDEGKLMRNLSLWLMLSGMEIVENDGEIQKDGEYVYYLKSTAPSNSHKGEDQYFAVKADDLSLYLLGSHPNTEGQKGKALERMKRHAIPGALDWVDEMVGKNGQGGLTVLPESTWKIAYRTFQLPGALITSVNYEQYGNIQKLQQAVWSLTEGLQNQRQAVEEMLSQGTSDDDAAREAIEQLEPTVEQLNDFRCRLLCHFLLPDTKDAEYNSNKAEELAEWMKPHMKDQNILLDILIQHLQSCLGVYKTQFPELFSSDGDKEGHDTIPLVGEVNTINAVMKWQGFTEHQKVYDSNAVFIFSILNSMTKEAKAIEEANAKMRKHK